MPIYDYRCVECGREVEVMHGIHERGPETCAACGGVMRKALSTPAIHFKGSGWAKKDAAASASKARSSGGTAGSATAPVKTADEAGKAAAGASDTAPSADTAKAASASSGSGGKGD